MSSRLYLAWNMLEVATYEDERREHGNFQAGMRMILGKYMEKKIYKKLSFIWENSDINNYMKSLHRHNEIVWLLGK